MQLVVFTCSCGFETEGFSTAWCHMFNNAAQATQHKMKAQVKETPDIFNPLKISVVRGYFANRKGKDDGR